MSEKEQLTEVFKAMYEEGIEVQVPKPVITIRDNYASPFSSGSNGYINKLRINKQTHELEYYHDWWNYGWFNKGYSKQVIRALKQVVKQL